MLQLGMSVLQTILIVWGIAVIVAIVALTFWREMWSTIRIAAKEEHDATLANIKSKTSNKGTLVWLMRSYVPNVKAGAEITAHALNKHLVKLGWNVVIVLPDFQQPDIDGVKCIKYISKSKATEQAFKAADVFFCQNYDTQEALKVLEPYKKPVVYFMHIEKEKQDILQQRYSVPIGIVYNSLTQKEQNPTIHESAIVRPFIPFDDFSPRSHPIPNGPVTLLNCNENKGGKLLRELAKRMRGVQFLGIQGAYSKQFTDLDVSMPNLRYEPIREDPRPIYTGAGIIIMPSKSESWGRVALEAMASGVPVIVSKAGGLRECTAGAAANYCRFDDASCWEQTINQLRSDPTVYNDAVTKGLKRIENLKREGDTDFNNFDAWITERIADWKLSGEAMNEIFTSQKPPPGWEG